MRSMLGGKIEVSSCLLHPLPLIRTLLHVDLTNYFMTDSYKMSIKSGSLRDYGDCGGVALHHPRWHNAEHIEAVFALDLDGSEV